MDRDASLEGCGYTLLIITNEGLEITSKVSRGNEKKGVDIGICLLTITNQGLSEVSIVSQEMERVKRGE